ncbi:MAG: general secretion pathway protein GspK [Bdellovibrionales bacterium]
MALMISLVAMMILTFIAMEVSRDTSVDYLVASQQVNRIKAYYAAKAGVEISLLRIMLYKQAVAAFGDALGGNTGMLDPIWAFPFMWPPTMLDAMTEVDKSTIKDAVDESFMSGQYLATIQPEGGRIDINDLGSDVKALKKSMIQQIVKIFQAEVEHNEDFADKYKGFNFEEVANNIADYIDEDSQSLNGGDESAPYRDVREEGLTMPPNRPLRTVDELHQVGGMTDEFYNVLAPRLTVHGSKGINVNYADKGTLMTLDVTMTDEAVDKAIARRSNPKIGGPFKGDQDFFGFLQPFGVDVKAIQDSKVPLLYDQEFNFRIVSTGISSNVQRTITVVTYDFPNLADRLAEMLNKQDEQDKGQAGGSNQQNPNSSNPNDPAAKQTQKNKIKSAKGRPTVVSWEEN